LSENRFTLSGQTLYPIGYFHIDIAQLHTAKGTSIYLSLSIEPPSSPLTNGQVERINQTTKQATVKRFHYDNHQQLCQHLAFFINAYSFARRLKSLKGLTPHEFIHKQ